MVQTRISTAATCSRSASGETSTAWGTGFSALRERRESKNHWKDRRSRWPAIGRPSGLGPGDSAQSRAMETDAIEREGSWFRPNGFSISTPASSIPSIPKATTATTRGAA